jgi:hypothetical protein
MYKKMISRVHIDMKKNMNKIMSPLIKLSVVCTILLSTIEQAFSQVYQGNPPGIPNVALPNGAVPSGAMPNGAAPNTPTLELKDIHLPDQINNLPTAMGWWITVIAAIVLLVFLMHKIKKYKALRKHQKLALKQIEEKIQAATLTMQEAIALTKWSAMQYFPRDDIAALHQDAFKHFLITQLPVKHQQQFTELANESFNDVYKADFETSVNESFNQAVLLWVKHALPPKAKGKKNSLSAEKKS